MKKVLILFVVSFISGTLVSQDPVTNPNINTATRMLQEDKKLTIGGYAQIDYNQPLSSGTYNNGVLDVHRLVLMFGYKFNERTKFITEIEFEHVKEVFVEQAFLQYEITSWLNFRGGLMLIPMGIINEYHEPPSFNGVERPNVDKYIVPTTWREIGAGFSGTFPRAGVSYQIYVVNGFSGYNTGPNISGSNGFRSGRQKGANSILTSPNLAFKLEHFGLQGFQLGLSGYFGDTQTTLYNGMDKSDSDLIATADSSVVSLSMLGVDVRYNWKGLKLRGQFNYGIVGNTTQYNAFTQSDVGSSIYGWYAELAYDLFSLSSSMETELIPFVRFENYNTHGAVSGSLVKNPAFDRSDLTFGLGWKITGGVMLKGDYQVFMSGANDDKKQQVNLGIGIWF